MAKPMFGGKKPTPGDVKKMVAAYSKVPPQLSDSYKRKVIGHARAAGAMQLIPAGWLKGNDKGKSGKGKSSNDKSSKGKSFGGKKAPPFAKKG